MQCDADGKGRHRTCAVYVPGPFVQDAIRTNLSYERYLLALCQAEVEQRETNRIERAIVNAKFPIMKELGSFDFNLLTGTPFLAMSS